MGVILDLKIDFPRTSCEGIIGLLAFFFHFFTVFRGLQTSSYVITEMKNLPVISLPPIFDFHNELTGAFFALRCTYGVFLSQKMLKMLKK